MFRHEVSYLGHVISAEGVRIGSVTISSVVNWNYSEDVQQLRSFLGLCAYYKSFVKGFQALLELFTN